MWITRLRLRDFRNHESTEVSFSHDVNILQGNNGQGKTSILEAIYYLCLCKSFKAQDDADAVRFDRPFFEIEGTFQSSLANDSLSHVVRVVFQRNEGKAVLLDKKRLDRFSELIGKFPVTISAPEDVLIVSGSPGDRRRWIDIALSQLQSVYLKDLQDYRQSLRQRNALLAAERLDLESLGSWDKELAATGARVILRRIGFVEMFAPVVQSVYEEITAGEECANVQYASTLGTFSREDSEKVIYERFIEILKNGRERELQRKVTLFGPHKDELRFLLSERPIREFGSQGQYKTFALALKFAEFFYMKGHLQRTPLLLLDDVFSELDRSRRERLIQYLENADQVFLTSAEKQLEYSINKSVRNFWIEKGRCETANRVGPLET